MQEIQTNSAILGCNSSTHWTPKTGILSYQCNGHSSLRILVIFNNIFAGFHGRTIRQVIRVHRREKKYNKHTKKIFPLV